MCICCPTSSKCVSKGLLRIGFGATLALYGLEHYMHFQAFSGMTTAGFSGVLMSLAGLWAYVLPALMIVGGVLLVVPYRKDIAAWCAGVALASIAIGLSLKLVIGALAPELAMQVGMGVNFALLWLLIFSFAVKGGCCGSSHGKEGAMGHVCTPGGGGCC